LYYVFDVLILAGSEVMHEPLSLRRELLASEIMSKLRDPVRESAILDASLPDLITAVTAQGLEGLVAKRRDSRYEPGQRSGAWAKMRVYRAQEFVIGGYTVGGQTLDALVFGCYDGQRLIYVARIRQRLHAIIPRSAVPVVQRTGDRAMSVREFARSPERPLG
jgi:bifunctional non-homologous end joining protein LigD